MTMQRLGKGHAVCGVPLPWDVYDEAGQLLLRKGFVLDNQRQLDSLMERGMFVDGANISRPNLSPISSRRYAPFELWDDIISRLGQLLRKHDTVEAFPEQIMEVAQMIRLLSERSQDAALAAMILLHEQKRYSLVHCLHAALLCDLVAIRLAWNDDRRTSVVGAALTMNISTVETQQTLADQAEPLTARQRIDIKHHPGASVEILTRLGVADAIWLQAVQDHHETPLGSGYPRGIKSVGAEATLVRTADVFSAKVSPRKNRKQMNGAQAARVLFTDADMTADNPFIAVLIKEIGIYPPGSVVKLANGETAIVFKRSGNAHTPIVLSLTNSKGTPEVKPIRRDTAHQEFKIQSVMPRDSVNLRINPASLWTT